MDNGLAHPELTPTGLPIACSLTDPELAVRAEQVRQEIFASVDERRELPDGYAFRFPGSDEWMARLVDFIAVERECCRFLRFGLTFEPDGGPVWLSLTGGDGVRSFIAQTFLGQASAG
jgi:hypothetical protein